MAFILAVVWVMLRAQWNEADATDPRKVLALEMAETVKARLPWVSKNGSRAGQSTRKLAERTRGSIDGQTGDRKHEEASEEQR